MTVKQVPLDQIQDNPYQTRHSYDGIEELAANIQASRRRLPDSLGLIHIPNGREVEGGLVQLAEGHRRLRAFRALAEIDKLYLYMPVNIVELSDRAMDDLVWSENRERKDLNPIEEALALQRTMAERNLTQEQLAVLRGLARSTVANKLRLLTLPADIRRSIEQGEINERQAMALLPLYQLPEKARQALAQPRWGGTSLTSLVKDARKGKSSADLRTEATLLVERSLYDISEAPWTGHAFADLGGVCSSECTTCPALVRLEEKKKVKLYCPDNDCKGLKIVAWEAFRLAEASKVSGIELLPKELERAWNQFHRFFGEEEPLLAEIMQAGCPHARLRLQYDNYSERKQLAGFPDIRILCLHDEGGRCSCLAARKAAATKADLAKQEENARKRRIENEIVAPAVEAILTGLAENHAGTWSLLLRYLHVYGEEAASWELPRIQRRLALGIVRDLLPYNPDHDFQKAHQGVFGKLVERGLAIAGPPTDLDHITEKVNRIAGWLTSLAGERPAVAAIDGNLKNIADHLAGLGQMLDEAEEADKQPIYPVVKVATYVQDSLELLRPLVADESWTDFEFATWLVRESMQSGWFKQALEKGSRQALEYALALAQTDIERSRALRERLGEMREVESC